jgi:hypothetical protein
MRWGAHATARPALAKRGGGPLRPVSWGRALRLGGPRAAARGAARRGSGGRAPRLRRGRRSLASAAGVLLRDHPRAEADEPAARPRRGRLRRGHRRLDRGDGPRGEAHRDDERRQPRRRRRLRLGSSPRPPDARPDARDPRPSRRGAAAPERESAARPVVPGAGTLSPPRAISSAGRAPPRQGGGHWFEPSIAHYEGPVQRGRCRGGAQC